MAGSESSDEPPVLRSLVWMGPSRRNIQAFPAEVQKRLGDELQLIQFGGMPQSAKKLKGIGGGVVQLSSRHAGDAYRAVIAVQLGEKIYVLHAFQKKSKQGVATPQRHVDLIKQRYAEAKRHAQAEK